MLYVRPAVAFGALAFDVAATASLAVGSPTVAASALALSAIAGLSLLPAAAESADRSDFPARALDTASAAKQAREGSARAQQQHGVSSVSSAAAASPSRRAYVTLLYSDFIEGTRALGQALRESWTSADTVVLVTPDVQQETREKLAQDGWIVRPVAVEVNPNQNFQSRLVFVYTKLLIVEMEDEYDRIVFLDADTLVLENIDELFECEPFCAVMRHSELLNSGVIVITPSKELFAHMHELIGELDSYTGGDQGFFNSFYPYFAACPAFEPYPIVGSRLPGVGSGVTENGVGGGIGDPRRAQGGVRELDGKVPRAKKGEETAGYREGGEERGDAVVLVQEGEERRRRVAGHGAGWAQSKGWGCKRLPTRYNGDWPLLFVDGDLQVVQGREAGPEAPEDWKRRKKVKVLHFTFGTAKPWNWWAYPFLPYVDLWLETFHRLDGTPGRDSRMGSARRKANKGDGEYGKGKDKRPRWSGVTGQALHGLAPLVVLAVVWRAAKRWTSTRRALLNMGIACARCIPVKALSATSLSGSVFNFAMGLVLSFSAAVLAFNAVPATKLGPARPEAAWAFFWGRATAWVVISEGFYLFLVSLKAHHVFAPPALRDDDAPYAGTSAHEQDADNNGDGGSITTVMPTPLARVCAVRRVAAAAVSRACRNIGGGGVAKGTGRHGGASGGEPCGPRRLALTETVGHLVLLSAMATSLVAAPLWVGLNGFPASREVVPGIARLLALLVVFTFSAIRLPPLWAAHARSFDSSSNGCSSRKR